MDASLLVCQVKLSSETLILTARRIAKNNVCLAV